MLGILTGGIGLLTNGISAITSAKRKKNAQNELNNYERQELQNAHRNRKISTVGSDLMREESSRTTASLVDAGRAGGMRGIFSMIPQIQGYNTKANAEAQNYLDDQVIDRERDIANDEMRIRSIKEQRDNQNIGALSSQVNAANQDMWSGITGAANSLSYMGRNFNPDFGGFTPQVDTVSSLTSNGLTPIG